MPGVSHPIARGHPFTGRQVLFVNEGFTVEIEGLPRLESDALLADLFSHITRRETLYHHECRQGFPLPLCQHPAR